MSDVQGVVDQATQQVIERLTPLGPIVAKPLFGTLGLYLEDRIFGLVRDGMVYFRTDAATVAKYIAHGSRPFLYRRANGRTIVMQYHQVPPHILSDPDEACAWAYAAAATAL